jgi:hypothetical protein
MARFWLILALLLTPLAVAAADDKNPPAILSIIPAQAEPGTTITLSGAGFTDKTTVLLGNYELAARVISSRQLSFDLPKLAAGLYALYLRRDDGLTSRTYNFVVLPARPVASALSPDSIPACASGPERSVTVSGKNFQEGSRLLFDGAAIKSRLLSAESISFQAPPVPAGLHQVQIQNPEETFSGVLGLLINARPEIQSVSQGVDYVTYYELIIEGTNFQQNSAVAVEGKRLQSMSSPGERDRLIFVDCHKLIYQRTPYDPTL